MSGVSKCKYSEEYLELNNALRSLWEQHVEWTRMTIISMVNNLNDVEFVTNRLLRNPVDFEAFLEPLYGEEDATRFKELLTEHLVIAAELLTALIENDCEAVKDTEQRWYANANVIATFLNSINPYLQKDEFLQMFQEHLTLTECEMVHQLAGNYAKGIAIYDLLEEQALMMADTMIYAIAKQFPDNFSCH